MTTIDRVNLAVCALHEPPACRHCDIPCDPTTREYRAVKLCSQCYDELGPITVVKKEKLCSRTRTS